jgi:HD-GYP domain-containing protein (c-di-GMP phosphodiesterase class II)
MRLADELGLGAQERSDLYYALLLKDAGCSSNAAKICSLFRSDDLRLKGGVKTVEWTSLSENFLWAIRNVAPQSSPLGRAAALVRIGFKQGTQKDIFETRCERGADIASELGFPGATAAAIRTLDEHWDGRGQPFGLRGDEIPLLGRIVSLAQSLDVFLATHGLEAAYRMARERRGTWFDPALVEVLRTIQGDAAFWAGLSAGELDGLVAGFEPVDRLVRVDEAGLDRIASAFARVIDAKSPFTARHSERVAEIAFGIGVVVGLDGDELRRLRRAALLHDIGKLGISNLILDKPGLLTEAERIEIERHPVHTRELLGRVAAFRELADDASDHHEKLDGSGYPRGLRGEELTPTARILVVADIFEAMTAARPYREPMPIGRVLSALAADAGSKLDRDCVAAFHSWIELAAAA